MLHCFNNLYFDLLLSIMAYVGFFGLTVLVIFICLLPIILFISEFRDNNSK